MFLRQGLSHVAQARLELTFLSRMILDFWSFCPHLLSDGITGTSDIMAELKTEPRDSSIIGKRSTNLVTSPSSPEMLFTGLAYMMTLWGLHISKVLVNILPPKC